MSATGVSVAIQSLQTQLQQLRAQVQQLAAGAQGSEALQPNYLTVAPGGLVSADFAGTISATGLTLPAGGAGTGPQNIVGWKRQADGAVIAQIFGQRGSADNMSLLELQASTDLSTDQTSVGLSCGSTQGTGAAFTISSTPAAASGSKSVVSLSVNSVQTRRKLLADDQSSDWLQAANNLSDLTNQATAQSNLGLGPRLLNMVGNSTPGSTLGIGQMVEIWTAGTYYLPNAPSYSSLIEIFAWEGPVTLLVQGSDKIYYNGQAAITSLTVPQNSHLSLIYSSPNWLVYDNGLQCLNNLGDLNNPSAARKNLAGTGSPFRIWPMQSQSISSIAAAGGYVHFTINSNGWSANSVCQPIVQFANGYYMDSCSWCVTGWSTGSPNSCSFSVTNLNASHAASGTFYLTMVTFD